MRSSTIAFRVAILCVAVSFAAFPASANHPETHNPALNPGWEFFYNNEYDDAIAYFEKQIAANPEDASQRNYLAQSLLYREMYRNGSLESQLVSGNNAFLRREKMTIQPETRRLFSESLTKSLALSKARLQKNSRDVEALHQQASAHALRSTYFFLVEKSWLDSLKEASAARKASEQVLEIDPSFVDAHLTLGVYSYVVGSLSFYMRALGAVGGFHGDKAAGIRQLQLVASQGKTDKYDARVALAVLYRRDHNPRMAIPLLQDLARTFPRNSLFRFEQVQMYSDLGDEKSAMEILTNIDQLRRSGALGYRQIPAEKICYVAGNLHFWYNDLPLALKDFNAATQHSETLDLNSAVLSWLRLGQVYDLLGRHIEAVKAYREAEKVGPGSEAANEAKGYIEKPYRRKSTRENS